MGKQHKQVKNNYLQYDKEFSDESVVKKGLNTLRVLQIKFKTERQKIASEAVKKNDLTFLIGAAGTGKTFIACSEAANALANGDCDGILLVRPAVEAQESIGFLPGSMHEKLDPYMRPLFDCFSELIKKETFESLKAHEVVEICALGFVRGRTFKNKVVIFDEMQNATREQLKMALTRLGEGSKCIVTMDPTQIDLEYPEDSCIHDVAKFKDQDGIGFVVFPNSDVVRSKIVKKVLEIYQPKKKV